MLYINNNFFDEWILHSYYFISMGDKTCLLANNLLEIAPFQTWVFILPQIHMNKDSDITKAALACIKSS